MKLKKVAALLTCYNRKPDTIKCLQLLSQQQVNAEVDIQTYLVDDGSTDGTTEAVNHLFPHVKVLQGDGSLFWNGGMRTAFKTAMEGSYDYYLWLNDDTFLEPDVIQRLVDTSKSLSVQGFSPAIIAGATRDPKTGLTTYSGVRRQYWWWPLRFILAEPESEPVQCDTMSGNCVLIPNEVSERIGNLDSTFKHYLGDYDYGLRARSQGCTVWVMPGYIGTCGLSLPERQETNISLANSLSRLDQPKGLSIGDADLTSFQEWRVFSQRHGGWLWPLYWLAPYRRMLKLPWLNFNQ